ncbi:MAG: flavodoxin family protein [Deltaproteobacteria bacterium]|nr:flavodoxin family protein [Deltaproteobacteria bacterium]
MKVLAFNCSPNMDGGNTALIFNPFLEGLEEEGAEVTRFYLSRMKIRPCAGDLHCWFKKPGICIHKDDMQDLYPLLRESDLWAFATPVYFDGVSGPMKNLMDRMVPLVLPFVELRKGHCSHPRREGTKGGKVVLVSSCGFWEEDNFDPLLLHMKTFCRTIGRDFAGALLRPTGGTFKGMLELGRPVGDILDAAREAGRQLAGAGRMDPETLRVVSRQLLPLNKFVEVSNRVFQEALDGLKKEEK